MWGYAKLVEEVVVDQLRKQPPRVPEQHLSTVDHAIEVGCEPRFAGQAFHCFLQLHIEGSCKHHILGG